MKKENMDKIAKLKLGETLVTKKFIITATEEQDHAGCRGCMYYSTNTVTHTVECQSIMGRSCNSGLIYTKERKQVLK